MTYAIPYDDPRTKFLEVQDLLRVAQGRDFHGTLDRLVGIRKKLGRGSKEHVQQTSAGEILAEMAKVRRRLESKARTQRPTCCAGTSLIGEHDRSEREHLKVYFANTWDGFKAGTVVKLPKTFAQGVIKLGFGEAA